MYGAALEAWCKVRDGGRQDCEASAEIKSESTTEYAMKGEGDGEYGGGGAVSSRSGNRNDDDDADAADI